MASSSASSSSQIKRYDVFTSFHGADVRQGFLSHLHSHFASKGITTFNDQQIVRGQTIGPELIDAIRESRAWIVVLSEKYASSSWCLDELVEIFNCKEEQGQTVIPIFYKVDPSDVKKQRGDFGSAFEKTCQGKSEEVKQGWSEALADVATIAGEHSLNWPNEAEMIQKIAKNVLEKLNDTPSSDFEDLVGLEAHLRNLDSLLDLESDDVKMIGIWGPAGIGKSTIVEALYSQLKGSFQLSCSMGNLKGSYKSTVGVNGYDSKLSLQSLLLSKILNQKDMRVNHLGAIKERLQNQKVLIVLDDVDDLEQLKFLAKDISWFGSGSRIIITTEDKKILKAHGINDIYHVDFPSEEEALEILCLSAFNQSSVPDGFEELAKKVAEFCGNLPLGLRVVGSSLHGECKHEWELQLSRIETTLDREIENILRIGYERLLQKDQSLFLHIACFFNNHDVDQVTSILADSGLDVRNGLKTLADKSLMHPDGSTVMHYLLQQLGKQIVFEQSGEPGKRQFLVEVEEIRDVLANETGTGSVIGISFDTSCIGNKNNFSVGKRAFEGMRNLRYLRIYRDWFGGEPTLQIPEDMEYLPRLRVLDWDLYPRKSLPLGFKPESLVKLCMLRSNLEKLWGGIQHLPNLKSFDLCWSYRLKEIPNLLHATNLEKLNLGHCSSLVELPSSIRNLHKLEKLVMHHCKKLRVIPTNINLACLEEVDMNHCSQLVSFPDISSNIMFLEVKGTKIKDIPPSVVRCWSRLECLAIGSRSLKSLTHFPLSVRELDLSNSDIERIPDSIIGLPYLVDLIIQNCSKIVSIPALSSSLESINANGCVSLKSVCCSFHNPVKLTFYNCLKLDEEARRGIIQQSILVFDYIWLPGKEIPAEFTHKATGNSITIPLSPGGESTLSASLRFKACILLSPIKDYEHLTLSCRVRRKGDDTVHWCRSDKLSDLSLGSEHLFIISGDLLRLRNRCHEVDVSVTISCWDNKNEGSCDDKIIECGVQIMTEEAEGSEVENFETGSSNRKMDYICLPGKKIPLEFTHKASGNSITIPFSPGGKGTFSMSSTYKACFLLSTIEDYYEKSIGYVRSKGRVQINITYHFVRLSSDLSPKSRSEHLFQFGGGLFDENYICLEGDDFKGEIVFQFSCKLLNGLEDCKECQVMECGVQISSEEAETSRISKVGCSEIGSNNNCQSDKAVHTGHRIWSREEDRTSKILGVVIVLCIFLIIQIFREIGISDPRS